MRLAAVAALAAGVLVACSSSPSAAPTAREYLAAWGSGDLQRAAALTDDPHAAAQAITAMRTGLHVTSMKARATNVSTHGNAARATFSAWAGVAGLGVWAYTGRLSLARTDGRWRVHWRPDDLHPALTPTTHLAAVRTPPARAPIIDDRGRPLFTAQPVVNIGVEPSRLHRAKAQTLATLGRVLGIDVATVTAAVDAARPDEFVPVITLRRAAYEQVKPRIYALPGTVFTAATSMLPPTTGFARAVLGTVGPATADVLRQAGPDYLSGDALGLSGLQLAFQRRLAGTASGAVVVEDSAGRTLRTLHRFSGSPGQAVQVTLDQHVQQAAEDALGHESRPAALVAVDTATGRILAAANTPNSTSFDRALDGRYPPGSTFKVVTTYALLGTGMRPSSPLACPPAVTVDGRQFRNFEHEADTTATFASDFAHSCNTAFVGASRRLGHDALHTTGTTFGIGVPWSLPLASFSGSVPLPADAVEQAADAIGQGRVEVSPLGLALVAAAVGSGAVHPPRLLEAERPSTTARLDPARIATLRSLMHLVVTTGTAAGAGLPTATFGKTGTAEFGSANPPQTHAWFLGFRGHIAFCVLVEGGGVGGAVAAPIAATFLRHVRS